MYEYPYMYAAYSIVFLITFMERKAWAVLKAKKLKSLFVFRLLKLINEWEINNSEWVSTRKKEENKNK